MSKFLTLSTRPFAKGSYKTVYNAEQVDGLKPALFSTDLDENDLVIIVIPIQNKINILDDIYEEYRLHQTFFEHGLAPKFYGFTLIHKPLKNVMIKMTPETLFNEGSFRNVALNYVKQYPKLSTALHLVYGIAVLEDKCTMVKWSKVDNKEQLPDIVYGISELFEKTVDIGYVFLDAKMINLCPNADLTKFKAIDFDTQFVKPYRLFFSEAGDKHAFLFMSIMIFTDLLQRLDARLHSALCDCFGLIFSLKGLRLEDVRNMVNDCYETCCENVLPNEQLKYNPLNMIYYYKMDAETDPDNKIMRTCGQLYEGVKEEIIGYLLEVTHPLFANI